MFVGYTSRISRSILLSHVVHGHELVVLSRDTKPAFRREPINDLLMSGELRLDQLNAPSTPFEI